MQTNLFTQPLVREAMRDLCCVVADNPLLRDGVFRARAADLAKRLDANGLPELTGADVQLVVDMAEAVVKAIMSGRKLVGTLVLMRICERVVNPITDALGYPGDVRG